MYQNSNQAIINRLNQAKPVDERDPYLKEGTHVLCVMNLGEFVSKKHGPAVGLTAVIVSSTNPEHQPGTRGFEAWFPNKQPAYVGDQKELDQLVDFCGKLLGSKTLPDAVAASHQILDPQAQMAQRFRGILVQCTKSRNPGRPKKDGSPGKPFWDLVWTHVDGQSPEQIAAYRAKVEAMPGFETWQPPQAQMQQAAPPQGQWVTPTPGQVQGYTQQPPQGWGQQPAQGQWPQQPQTQQVAPQWQAQGPGVTTQTAAPQNQWGQQAPAGPPTGAPSGPPKTSW